MPDATGPHLTPVRDAERIEALDVARGLALFGVLQINLIFFSGHGYRDWAQVTYPLGWGGHILIWFRNSLLDGKAMSLFSLLFGMGLSIQMERARERGSGFPGFATRRLGALALIGTFHAVFIWNGDILLDYATIGFLMLAMLRLGTKPLLWVCLLALLGPRAVLFFWPHLPDTWRFAYWMKQSGWILQSADAAFGHGSWAAAFKWRYWEWLHVGQSLHVVDIVLCLPLFLVGAAIWRSGILSDLPGRIGTVRKIFHGTFWLGLLLNISSVSWSENIPASYWRGVPGYMLTTAVRTGVLMLAVGYFFGVVLLLQQFRWERILRVFAPMGRMALTNYLSQSLIATWVFNGHGLGLWDKVTPSAYILGGVGLYAIQIAWSHWWLRRFRFGPMEWLWRSASYAAWQPMAIRPATPIPEFGTAPAEP